MKKRRILSIVLAALMVISCAVPALAAAEPTKISFTLWGTNEGLTSVFALVDEFNATHPDIQVTVNGIDPSVYFQKLNAFFASGDAPDVIQVAADYGDAYTSKDVFAPLDDYMTDDLKGLWADSLMDALKYDGKQYAIPIGVQNSFIAYNKKLFDEASLAYPTNDWTEAQFLDLAKKLTIPDKNQFGVLIAGNCLEMVWDLYGNYCYDWTNKKMHAADNDSFKHAVQMFYDMYVTDKVTPAAMNTKDIGGGFETGKYPMAVLHYWDLESMSKTIGTSFEWDIVQFPKSEEYGTRWKSPLYVQALSISASSQHKDQAFEFIKWWASSEKPQTAMADSFPVCTNIYNTDAYLTSFPAGKTYDKKVVIDTLQEQGIAWWNTGVIAEINNNVLSPALQKLFLQTEKVSVDDTIKAIQDQGQQTFDMAE